MSKRKVEATFYATSVSDLACTKTVTLPDDVKSSGEVREFLREHQREIDGGDYGEAGAGDWNDKPELTTFKTVR